MSASTVSSTRTSRVSPLGSGPDDSAMTSPRGPIGLLYARPKSRLQSRAYPIRRSGPMGCEALSRRQVLARGLLAIAAGGPLVLLASACAGSPPAPAAKPTTAPGVVDSKPAAPAGPPAGDKPKRGG